jgi:DNA polymerase-3 subunit beta
MLARALKKVVPFTATTTSLHVLTNVFIQFLPDIIKLRATNLDEHISEVLNTTGEWEATLLISAKRLFDVVRELPAGDVTLSVDADHLKINSGNGFSCSIAGISTEYESDFPMPPEIGDSVVVVQNSVLDRLARIGGYAVSNDQARAVLQGAYFQFFGDSVTVASTDGHRLAEVKGVLFQNEEPDPLKLVIPPSAILKHLNASDLNGKTFIAVGEGFVSFQSDTTRTYAKLIDGPYPDYEKVIPDTIKRAAIVSKNELSEALRRSSVVANQKTQLTVLEFDSLTGIKVSVNNREVGSTMDQTVDAEYTGEDGFRIGFNAKLFIELLSKVSSDRIRIGITSTIGASLITPIGEDVPEERFILMPLRILDAEED